MSKCICAIVLLLSTSISAAATCKINEYKNLAIDDSGRIVPLAQEPHTATQSITYTTSTQSAAFNSQTRFLLIICDAKAHLVFGSNPTATAASFYVGANIEIGRNVERGSDLKVALYDGSS